MILLNAVLVATDFGETSRAALDYGRNLARAFGGTLHLLHVVDAVVVASAAEFYPNSSRDMKTELIEEANRGLDALLTTDDRKRLHAVPAVRASGSTAATIVEYAKQAHVDVIVVGTHGRGPIAHFFMGSVAEHVARHAPCPVLVVRPNEHEFIVPDPVGVHARI
jgi:nucleotide-binding universal stress UspA family protein